MQLAIYLPLLLGAVFGQLAPLLARRLPPAASTWLLSAGGLLTATASTACLALLAATLVGQSPRLAADEHWSDQILRHDNPVPSAVAAAALVALAVVTGRIVVAGVRRTRTLRRTYRLAAALPAPAGELAVLDDPAPYAYAVPGRPGRIAVSTGLLRRLDTQQRRALLAHERAHLVGRHHWHATATGLAAAANPLLHRLPTAVTLACERWADERAATVARRDTVAAALLRAATTAPPPSTAVLAAAVTDLADRIGALRGPAPRMRWGRIAVLVGLLVAIAVTLVDATNDTNRLFDLAQAAYRAGHH